MTEDHFRVALEGLVLQEFIRLHKLDFRTDVARGALQYAQHYYMLMLVERNLQEKYYERLKTAYDPAVQKTNRGGNYGNNNSPGRNSNSRNVPG